MKKAIDPGRLNLMAFARAGEALDASEPVGGFGRLVAEAQGPVEGLQVRWRARGELRAAPGDAPQVWLHLAAQTDVPLTCQRCLRPLDVALAIDRWFRFAADEAAAAALDDEVEEDVLVLSGEFDLRALVEDELLMALPLVPRHDACPVEVKLAAADPEFEAAGGAKPNPFAALASLRVDKSR